MTIRFFMRRGENGKTLSPLSDKERQARAAYLRDYYDRELLDWTHSPTKNKGASNKVSLRRNLERQFDGIWSGED